ncbi:MAG: peptidylprolyl isomerase [Bacteroidales bacterium]|jgi:peptidyl-prolyl cis-trans isomerase B (cyclophilin B)|nr:peptidylprolyl isomerase [Bacteroidales bacterium]
MKWTKLFIIATLTVSLLGSCSAQNKDTKAKKTDVKREKTEKAAQEKQDKFNAMTKVLIKTSLGDIKIALYNETPLHRDNFIKLVNNKFYDGVLFHRIIQGFMIQTGDPDSKKAPKAQMLGNGGPGYTIPAEFVSGLFHKRGAVAAARMGDNVNPKKESSGSQFYIVDGKQFPYEQLERMSASGYPMNADQKNIYATIGGAPHLDGAYTVFGEVIEGMDIVDKIAAQPKDNRDRPSTDIKILEATIIE